MTKILNGVQSFYMAEDLFSVLHKAHPEGISFMDMKMLLLIDRYRPESMKDFKTKLQELFPNVPKTLVDVKFSQAMKSLIDKDLITKEKSTKDRRVVNITLTTKGSKTLIGIKTKLNKEGEAFNK